jgi:hypothetical protein
MTNEVPTATAFEIIGAMQHTAAYIAANTYAAHEAGASRSIVYSI